MFPSCSGHSDNTSGKDKLKNKLGEDKIEDASLLNIVRGATGVTDMDIGLGGFDNDNPYKV
jgi:hypothetical protein